MGDMIDIYKILTGKVDVTPETWFTPLATREGAAITRATSGYLNLSRRKEAQSELRKNQFSKRVVAKLKTRTYIVILDNLPIKYN